MFEPRQNPGFWTISKIEIYRKMPAMFDRASRKSLPILPVPPPPKEGKKNARNKESI
jgi:hypothetical protein